LLSVSRKLASTDKRNVFLVSVGGATDIIKALLGTIETSIGDVICSRNFRSLTIARSFRAGVDDAFARSAASAPGEKPQTNNASTANSAEFREMVQRQRMDDLVPSFLTSV
jgi:hypothetical protein